MYETGIRDEKIDPGKEPEKDFFYIGLEDIESNIGYVKKKELTKGRQIKSLKNLFYKGDVLYGRLRPALNKVYMADDSGICSTDIWVINCSERLLPAYLSYYLRVPQILDYLSQSALGGQLPRVARDVFGRIPIPLPPLPEQQHIVNILQDASTFRIQQVNTIDQIKKLVPILFGEMFGDPRDYDKKWSTRAFGRFVEYSKYGPRFPNRAYAESGARILRTTDMDGSGLLRWWESPIMPVTSKELEEHALKPGTLLISRSGTIGPVGLFSGADEPCVAGAYLIEFGLSEEMNHRFIVDFFLSDYGQAMLKGGSQSMTQANLNAPSIRNIPLPTPPRKLQDEYEIISSTIRELAELKETENNELDELIVQLMVSGFSGELTKTWREGHGQEQQPALRKRNRVSIEVTAPPERTTPSRTTRHWLMDQLSDVQGHVYRALQEWKGTLIPSEDLDRFLTEWPIEHLEDAHDRVLRILGQLAGLGLIACVSLVTESGDYVTAYRVLREDELTLLEDRWRLGAPA